MKTMANGLAKRFLDLFIIFASLPLTAPIMLATAALLRATQGPGTLFTQRRIGKNGRAFTMVKFRTMRTGSGSDIERTTFIGNLLRKLSIDELPEIWNIFKGDMSVVGPRPLPVQYEGHFSRAEYRRHDVLPGLTGLAQVTGRNLFSWEQKFKKDLEYVAKNNLLIDIKIIFLTFKAVFSFKKVNADITRTMSPLSDRLHIIGSGGHAKVVYECAIAAGHEVAGVYDDDKVLHGESFFEMRIKSPKEIPANALVVLAIGANETRERLSSLPYRFATIVHPSAIVSPSAQIGPGSVVLHGAIIQAKTKIEEHVIINTGASVDHDCVVKSFAHLAPKAVLCGGVKIGKRCLAGAGSSFAPGVCVSSNITVAPQSAVNKNLNEKGLYVGAPAKIKTQKNKFNEVA